MVQVNLTASTDLHTLDEFRNCVVKQVNGAIVRLKDVAQRHARRRRLRIAGRLRRQARGVLSASRSRRPPTCST